MKFRFEFDIKKLPEGLTHHDRLLLIGSCFTENIGTKLDAYKFKTLQNPNGILFNPVSVAEAIVDGIENRQYTEGDLFCYNEAWHSWNHHSRFSGITVQQALDKMNESSSRLHQFLKTCDYLFITLGSAWIYRLTDKALNFSEGKVAANNHKAPSDWFNRRLLAVEEVQSVLDNMMHRVFLFNPNTKIIFTISPVRHLREGVVENNRSKAVLIQAVHQLVDKFEKLWYFPAYELVLDDLRDYRYYSEDLVHPNYFATQYVWERMVEATMSEPSKQLIAEIHDLNLAVKHKPFNSSGSQHQKFLASYLQKTRLLSAKYPYLDFSTEIMFFEQGIINESGRP